jgi:hypothetical protein
MGKAYRRKMMAGSFAAAPNHGRSGPSMSSIAVLRTCLPWRMRGRTNQGHLSLTGFDPLFERFLIETPFATHFEGWKVVPLEQPVNGGRMYV